MRFADSGEMMLMATSTPSYPSFGAEHRRSRASTDHARERITRTTWKRAWALRPVELVREHGRTMLIVEYAGGEPLSRVVQQPMETGPFLRLAAALSSAVGQLHGRGLIHKDIKPGNVLVESATGRVQLAGFGIASRSRAKDNRPSLPSSSLEHSLHGARTNRAREPFHRFTQRPLFAWRHVLRDADRRSAVHGIRSDGMGALSRRETTGRAQRADQDHPARGLRDHHEAPLETAEDRYQTAAGVESDLRRCLSQWELRGSIDAFTPGAMTLPIAS